MVLEIQGSFLIEISDLEGNVIKGDQHDQILEELNSGSMVIGMATQEILVTSNMEHKYNFKIVDVFDYTEYSFTED